MAILLQNRKAKFEYSILETYQAGLSLSGKMVKQIRNKRVTLEGRFIIFQGGSLQIIGFGNENITENISLLVKKSELTEIKNQLKIKGLTVIPLQIKQIGRWLKMDIAVAKGKKLFNKKQAIMQRDLDREQERERKFTNKN